MSLVCQSMYLFVAQNHKQVPLTHDGQQNADTNFKITTAHMQKVVSVKASDKDARGLAQKLADNAGFKP